MIVIVNFLPTMVNCVNTITGDRVPNKGELATNGRCHNSEPDMAMRPDPGISYVPVQDTEPSSDQITYTWHRRHQFLSRGLAN